MPSSIARTALTALCLLAVTAVAAPASDAVSLYGEWTDERSTTAIADILAAPDEWAGQAVQVSGTVVGVCSRKGCWIELEDAGARLQVKVEDDVIVFPSDAPGHHAVAQGEVEILELEPDAYAAWKRHEAEERGEPFDEDALEPPYRVVRLKGTGARIGD